MKTFLIRRQLRRAARPRRRDRELGFAGDATVWTIAGILLIVALILWILRAA